MKVTIITAVYNGEETLEDTIQSVLSQSYHDIEHIIVDGNSSDSSLKIAMRYIGERCKVISENDKGFYDALNKGIALARGEVIGILNADDVYANTKIIETIVANFKSRGDLDCVYGDLYYIHQSGRKEVIFRKWIAGEFSLKKMKYGWMPPHPTVFMKKAVYERTGGFDLRFKISADYEFLLRAFKYSDFKSKYIPCTMVHMKLGGLSNRSWGNIKIKIVEDYRIMKENMMPTLFSLFIKNFSKLHQLRRIF